jgi:periplasmic protein TonB
VTSSSPRPLFESYALPLPRRREGPAAAVSFVAHVLIAVLVLWRGAVLFESGGGGGSGPRGGGGGGGRPAVSWVALPTLASAQAPAPATPPPAVTVPTVAEPLTDPVKLDVPQPIVATAPSAAPAPVGTGDGTAGGPGSGPGSGGGKGTGTGTGTGSDAGPGSGGSASDIFAPTPRWAIMAPPGAPQEARGRHEVRFWVTAEGRVARVEVNPPIKDSGYRREFTERMMGYVFNPATTRDGRHVDYVTSLVVYP